MENKQITAVEAKKIAETSEIVKKRINKAIKEAANEGMLKTNFGFAYPSMVLLEAIKSDLINRGFEVILNPDDDNSFVELIISWDK